MESGSAVMPVKAVIIGSGNIASAVAPALEVAGAIDVVQVYSPTAAHASALARRLRAARGVSRPEDVDMSAELYLVAVKDDAIALLASQLPRNGAVWLHTSGGVDCSTLAPLTDDYGVFYPLQTFSKGREVDLAEVPVFIEGHTQRALQMARRLADAISPKVYEADGEVRARLHAAAVFACNFANHLWAVADEYLRRETSTDLSVLHPLLCETMAKAMTMPPADAQTGPARRGDRGVIEKHKSLLNADEARLYEILSQHIIDRYECD